MTNINNGFFFNLLKYSYYIRKKKNLILNIKKKILKKKYLKKIFFKYFFFNIKHKLYKNISILPIYKYHIFNIKKTTKLIDKNKYIQIYLYVNDLIYKTNINKYVKKKKKYIFIQKKKKNKK